MMLMLTSHFQMPLKRLERFERSRMLSPKQTDSADGSPPQIATAMRDSLVNSPTSSRNLQIDGVAYCNVTVPNRLINRGGDKGGCQHGENITLNLEVGAS